MRDAETTPAPARARWAPRCGRDPNLHPLEALCFLGKLAETFPADCAKPEVLSFCDGAVPEYATWGCIKPGARSQRWTVFETRWDRPLPLHGQRLKEGWARPGGVVAGVTVTQRVEGEARGETLAAAWRKQLRAWGCVPRRGRLLHCGDYTVEIRHWKQLKWVHLSARTAQAQACHRRR